MLKLDGRVFDLFGIINAISKPILRRIKVL